MATWAEPEGTWAAGLWRASYLRLHRWTQEEAAEAESRKSFTKTSLVTGTSEHSVSNRAPDVQDQT